MKQYYQLIKNTNSSRNATPQKAVKSLVKSLVIVPSSGIRPRRLRRALVSTIVTVGCIRTTIRREFRDDFQVFGGKRGPFASLSESRRFAIGFRPFVPVNFSRLKGNSLEVFFFYKFYELTIHDLSDTNETEECTHCCLQKHASQVSMAGKNNTNKKSK